MTSMNGASDKTGRIIIVGGGIAGLEAAKELLALGHSVIILEANSRLGGRIYTIRDSFFKQPVEMGVEFIHGNLPLTIKLLKTAGITYVPVEGDMVRVANGNWITQDDFALGWDKLMQQMNEVKEDLTVDDFLEKNFGDKKYEELRKSVLRFAEGFDLADTSRASVLALREEWMEEEGRQYRIPGGYDQIIDFLEKQCVDAGGMIYRSSPVARIEWSEHNVTVITANGVSHQGSRVVVTIPISILQEKPSAIIFQPAIDDYLEAAKNIGFGSVIKILLEFKEAFWEEKKKNIGFIFTSEIIPTWWTQLPSGYPLLTGWVGGPQVNKLKGLTDKQIIEAALQSLSAIFQKPVVELEASLTTSMVANWNNDVYSKGGYSYGTVKSVQAQKTLNVPVGDTLFFAGEAIYEGSSPGTVEAALVSARNAVEKIKAA